MFKITVKLVSFAGLVSVALSACDEDPVSVVASRSELRLKRDSSGLMTVARRNDWYASDVISTGGMRSRTATTY